MDFSAQPTAWMTTLRADGSPHTTPVWFVVLGESFWVATSLSAVKAKNIDADPRVSLAIDGTAIEPHVAEGRAQLRTDFDELAEVVETFKDKYDGWDPIDPSMYGARVLVEIPRDRWLLRGWNNS